MTDMPKRIWAYPPGDAPDDGGVYYKMPHDFVDPSTEYIRADSVPDVDVEDIAHEVRDAIFKAYGVIIDPVWLERILRKALEVRDD